MSEFNITIESGTSKRLPIGNKWSPKDILVTATGGEDVSEETVEYTAKLEILETAITDLETALRHKESVQPVTEPLSVTENGTYRPLEGVDGYSIVNVNVPIPNDYIKPSGTLEVTENGTHDVTEYASVDVNVSHGITETWIFTMEDGTEVVKEVVVV